MNENTTVFQNIYTGWTVISSFITRLVQYLLLLLRAYCLEIQYYSINKYKSRVATGDYESTGIFMKTIQTASYDAPRYYPSREEHIQW